MIWVNIKRKKEYRDVILAFTYLGILAIFFSILCVNTFIYLEVLLSGIFFIGISIGMIIIVLLYYLKTSKKKKLRLSLEQYLVIFLFLSFSCFVTVLSIIFNSKLIGGG